MAGGVTTEFSGKDRGLKKETREQATEAGKLGEAYKEGAKTARQLERDAKKAFEQIHGPQLKFNRQQAALNKLLTEGKIDQREFAAATRKAQQELDNQGKSGTSALDDIASGAKSLLTTYGSIGSAIGLISQSYQTWIDNAREASEQSRNAASELASFLALQEGGVAAERAQRVQAAALEFGVTERGTAYDTAQAMQSIRGDFEAGMEATREVFRATLAGIPIDLGRELEVFGATAGKGPGEFLRLAFAAGQLSGRDPEALAKTAPVVGLYRGTETGFAAASQLAGAFRPEQLETFTKSAAIALSDMSSAQESFVKAGLKQADEVERLRYLQQQGIDTASELKEFGLTEIRQIQAIEKLVPLVDEMERVREKLEEAGGNLSLIAGAREKIEAASPQAVIDKFSKQQKAGFAELQAADLVAAREMAQAQARGAAYARRGLTQAGPFDLISPEGVSTGADLLQALLAPQGPAQKISTSYKVLAAELEVQKQVGLLDDILSTSRTQAELMRDLRDSLKQTEQSRYRERKQKVSVPD